MSNCFTCGKTFNGRDRDTIRVFKEEFKNKGVERYVYRLSPSSEVQTCRKEYFSVIYNNEIKPNLKNGAEYMHIQEYTGA